MTVMFGAIGAAAILGAMACPPGSPPAVPAAAATAPSTVMALPSAPAVGASASAAPVASARVPTSNVRLLHGLGDFAVATPPVAAYPKGTLAALSSGVDNAPLQVVEVDLATATEVGRVALAPAEQAMIAPAEHGVVVASTQGKTLSVTWLDGARTVRATHRVEGFGAGGGNVGELFGLSVIAGHVVIVDGQAHAMVVDDRGKVVAKHTGQGGLFHPGTAEILTWGSRAVVANLIGDWTHEPVHQPVCAFRADGPGPTLKATLPEPRASFFVQGGSLYARGDDGGVHQLGDDLKPRADAVHLPETDGADAQSATRVCRGLTGTAIRQSQKVGDLWVVHSISCCGDESPGGLFLCDPSVSP